MQSIKRSSCIRCGTCCLKGGPVLHHQDKRILLDGRVGYQHLITIRKGELALDPAQGTLKPVPEELVKVRGKGSEWACCFFDTETSSCSIYEHRFLECRLLKCWDTADIQAVIGKNTVVRTDLINPGDPVIKVIEFHEKECPYSAVEELVGELSRETRKPQSLAQLTEIARKDLAIRFYALSKLSVREEFELFLFGRPVFKILNSRGIEINLSA
ncbi:MAG: YkgJ family cysteine cluster protein [Bacillota bacterium]